MTCDDITTLPPPGSEERPFKLAIIGGGPSGCSVIVRAVRTGNVDELCNDDDEQSLAGVCIIDQCTLKRFGGGRLQDYVINSNTFANKFASNVLEDKADSLPPETCKGTYFEKLKESENCKLLENAGSKQGSLEVVGGFLRDVGRSVIETIVKYPSSSCLFDTKVLAVQKWEKLDSLFLWRLTISTDNNQERYMYARDVLFATGGRQETPVLPNSYHNSKIVSSDFVVTEEGIEDIRKRVRKSIKNFGKHKIVIVGGSHSAFSAAWICLNKLGDGDKDKDKVKDDKKMDRDGVDGSKDKEVDKGASKATSLSTKIEKEKNTISNDSSNSVLILHRSFIKVFYSTKKEADTDYYHDIGVVNKSTGQIHPFGGLRGDSKALWREVKQGRESRVRLLALRNGVDINQQNIATKLFDEAAVIIWACGYLTNICPVYEADGVTKIPLCFYRGQVEVDDLAQILTNKAPPSIPKNILKNLIQQSPNKSSRKSISENKSTILNLGDECMTEELKNEIINNLQNGNNSNEAKMEGGDIRAKINKIDNLLSESCVSYANTEDSINESDDVKVKSVKGLDPISTSISTAPTTPACSTVSSSPNTTLTPIDITPTTTETTPTSLDTTPTDPSPPKSPPTPIDASNPQLDKQINEISVSLLSSPMRKSKQVRTYMYLYIYICQYIYIIYIKNKMFTFMWTYIHIQTCTYIFICIYIHVFICTYIHIYIFRAFTEHPLRPPLLQQPDLHLFRPLIPYGGY
jgi:hypothetical protein